MKEKQKFLTYKGAIRPSEVNGSQQMKFQYFIDRYEQSGRQFFGFIGLSKQFLTEHNAGIAVLEQDIQFNDFLFEDDLIYIESHLVEFMDKVFTVYHEIKDSFTHKVKSEASIKTVLFDMTRRKAISIPETVKKRLEKML